MTRAAMLVLLPWLRFLQAGGDGPLAPEAAAASFRHPPDIEVQLAASEPAISDPVAMAFDGEGRLYVAENRGYPSGPGPGKPPAGRVALLEDADGDGRFERRSDFAAGLAFPNGVLPWKGGLFVTAAPDLLYLEDTDGDGRSDRSRVVLSGFSTGGSTQLRVSHPTLGPDGWIYLTSGLTGGKIACPSRPELAPLESRADVRFDPETLQYESADGGGQFGLTFDDFGRRFVCFNRVQVQHVVMSARHLKRNPFLAFSETLHNCPDLQANPLLRGGGGAARLYPISANKVTADSHAGTFTAACAVTIYRGGALPEAYRGGVFSCDPTGNLIHFDRLDAAGATFAARPAREGVEFLASTDNWFRPVFLSLGPDGALYACAMYRRTIEHPDYLPEEIRKRTDFDGGKGMGRIYRIRAAGAGPAAPLPKLSAASTEELEQLLDHPYAWRRDAGFRRILERRDAAAVPLLKLGLKGSRSAASMVSRLRLLDLLSGLDDGTLADALGHPEPRVREASLQLAEARLAGSPALLDRALKLCGDADARVRFQAALAAGAAGGPRIAAALAEVARRDAGDRWTRAAVLSSAGGIELALLDDLQRRPPLREAAAGGNPDAGAGSLQLFQDLGRIAGARCTEAELEPIFRQPPEGPGANLPGAAEREAAALRLAAAGGALAGRSSGGGALPEISRFAEMALQLAQDVRAGPAERKTAVRFLGQAKAGAGRTLPRLLVFVDGADPLDLRLEAARAAGELDGPEVAAELLKPARWGGYSPALREAALAAALHHPAHWPGLLDAIEAGTLPPGIVEPSRRKQMLEAKDGSVRDRAEKIFRGLGSEDRRKVYEENLTVLGMKAAPGNGREVFRRLCAGCHRLDGAGTAVGPDLFDVRNQEKAAILLQIIIPEHEIMPGFTGYLVLTRDGRSLSGLLSSETATSITIRQAQGVEETLLRQQVLRIASSSLSLMPQELEKQMTRQELADLLAYLKGEG